MSDVGPGTHSRPHPLRDAALAFTLLTALPLNVRWTPDERPDAAGWFPLVGAILGMVAAMVVTLAGLIVGLLGPSGIVSYTLGSLAWPLAVVVVAVWALLTRMLHWDGLADTADGIGGASESSARRAIMADSATGAFGATAVVLVALLQVTALGAILASTAQPLAVKLAFIVSVPVLGRLAATFACWLGSPANPGGLGASVMGRPRPAGMLAALVVLGGCAGVLFAAAALPGVVWLAAGVISAAAVPHALAGRVGGVTGDIMGASVLLTEALVLLMATVVVTA